MTQEIIYVLVGLLCGILSGFGIGGGSLLMIWLTAIAGISQKLAQGINLLYFLPAAAVSLLVHMKHKLVCWSMALPAILCGCVSAAGAAWLAQSVETEWLRKGFGIFLLVVGILELRKGKKHRDASGQ